MRDGVDSIWRGAWQDMIYPLGVCSRQRRGAAADAAASSWWRCDHGGVMIMMGAYSLKKEEWTCGGEPRFLGRAWGLQQGV
jgi:hypothetical protein